MNIKNILVPLDFSASAEQAFEYAEFLADKFAANLTLLHTILSSEVGSDEEMDLMDYERIVKKIERNKNELLKEYVLKATAKEIPVEAIITRGFSAGDSILDFINTGKYDLVVMGSRSGSGLIKWNLGSVAEKVIHASSIPVFTLHHSVEEFAINRILIPVDFSNVARDASKLALSLGKIFKSDVEFLHVVDKKRAYANGDSNSKKQTTPQVEERIQNHLSTFIDNRLENIDLHVKEGKIPEEIVDYANQNKHDLIIMATGEKSGLDYLQIGSNTNCVVRLAHCPVLTINKS